MKHSFPTRRSSELAQETVHHILKGGEDSNGFHEAIQRVYFNIGSCSEQCWVNHLTDLRQLDPQGRNFGQTPFDIAQCRRDCPAFRAIEDRSEEHTSELQSLMRSSYAVFCLKKKKNTNK